MKTVTSIKHVMLTLVLFATAMAITQAADRPDSLITGRWQATEGVAFAPWTFDLQADGNRLTGTVSMGSNDGRGVSTSLTMPVAIADGQIDGNNISFTVTNPRASNRMIVFKGRVESDRISFQRDVQVLGSGDLGRDGIYGINGARQFVAQRVSSQPMLSTLTNPPDMPRARNVSGRWIVQGVPNGPWTLDLNASGSRLTGTIRDSREMANSADVFDGAVDGPLVFFKSKSPDGSQTMAFTGIVNGNEMTILRAGGANVSGPAVVMAKREPRSATP
jgi:hypothetical protein